MQSGSKVYATLPVNNMEECQKFYEETLGLEKDSESPGGILYKSGDSGVFVYESQFAGTNKATAATWVVDDIDGMVKNLKDKGVTFEKYDMPEVVHDGDIHVFGDMRSAWFKDPAGNILNVSNNVQ